MPQPLTPTQARAGGPDKMSSGVGMVDNLATLSTLDEHSLVEELRARYSRGIIYTYIGDILIAFNPYAPLPIYDSAHLFKYTDVKIQSDVPPHIFAIADRAYQNMRRTSTSQCCIVSGESGAGKTESTKFLVQQIAHLCNYSSGNLQEKILQVNPLLEAFGNAVTVMNNNSSRFGKYIELKFDPEGNLLGVHIFEYLLESTRVLSHGEGESNFHMFYYMFAGLYEKQLKDNLLNSPDDHRILRTEDGTRVFKDPQQFVYYQQMWDELRHTMDIVGFSTEDVDGILTMLAAILHISDIFFETDDETDGVCIPNEDPLEMAALLLAVPDEMLATALISKVTHLRGEEIVTLKDLVAANEGRDALVKTLYSRLFGWIVRQINVMLQPDTRRHITGPSIGILDMAGFENFEKNSFEQLCINATNEQLQYYFNQQVFQWEMDEYKREGVKAKDIKYTDNRPLVDLFLENPIGVFSLLDEESRFPKANDLTLLEKLSKNLTKKQLFQRPKGNAPFFTINHYAGPVTYDVRGFLEKNRDTLSWNLLSLMKESDSQFMSDLFHASITDTGSLYFNSNQPKRSRQSILLCKAPELSKSGAGAKSLSKQAGRKVKARAHQTQGTPIYENAVRTQGAKFKNSLTDLMGKLLDAGPHFVRCIKPNTEKHPELFQVKQVQQQLKYTGVMETIRIRRQGYATRLPFEVFFSRYRFIAFRIVDKVDPSVANCTKIMKRAGLEDFQIGKSKIFLKYYHMERLNLVLDKNLWSVIKCQSVARGYIDRRRVRWLHKASMQDKIDLRAFLGHVTRDMDELYRSLSHQESHDKTRHDAMIQEAMMNKAHQAQQAQVALRNGQNHASPMTHAPRMSHAPPMSQSPMSHAPPMSHPPMSHAHPMSRAPPVSAKPSTTPDDEYLQRKPKKLIYQATPILLGNPVTGNPNPINPNQGAANSQAAYVEYATSPVGQPEWNAPSPRGDLPLGDPRRMPDSGQYGQWHAPPGEYPTFDQRAPPFTAPRPGMRRSHMSPPSPENEYPTESMLRPSGPSNYDYDNTTHYANPSTLPPSPICPTPALQHVSQQFLERHLLEAIEQWPRESVWLKVLPIERSQVVANVNIAGSELIIDDSKQQPTSNVIGLRGFNNLQRDAATEKVLKKIGKGIKITRDAEGNIYAKQLSKSEIIMKGYKYPEDCCLSSEVVSKLGRLSKHPQKIFDMSKFKSSIATELRNTVIDKRRLMHLCMITFSFVRNVFDDLDTPCWVCLINYAAMATLGTDEMLDAVKESCNIQLTETEDVQMRRNWQQMGCSPASYDMDAMPPQEQFDAMAWHGYGNGIQHPSRPTDQTDGHTDQTGGSSNTPARVRSNSPGYAESIPYTKYEGPPQIGKRREWAKLARKRDSY